QHVRLQLDEVADLRGLEERTIGYVERSCFRHVSRTTGKSISGLAALLRPPATDGDAGPDGLDQSEWPGPLQEAVGRPERARPGERQHEPVAAPLERVGHEHRRHGEQPEGAERGHWARPFLKIMTC